jgi:hypothetical protein
MSRFLYLLPLVLLVGIVTPEVAPAVGSTGVPSAFDAAPLAQEPTPPPTPTFTPIPRPGEDRPDYTKPQRYRYRPVKLWEAELLFNRYDISSFDFLYGGQARLGRNIGRFCLSGIGEYFRGQVPTSFRENARTQTYRLGVDLLVSFGSERHLPAWFEPFARASVTGDYIQIEVIKGETITPSRGVRLGDGQLGGGAILHAHEKVNFTLGVSGSTLWGDARVNGVYRLLGDVALNVKLGKMVELVLKYRHVGVGSSGDEDLLMNNFLKTGFNLEQENIHDYIYNHSSILAGLLIRM